MEKPNLERIVDTYVPIVMPLNPDDYFAQLRNDVIPHIRRLKEESKLRWFAILIHDHSQLHGRVPPTDQGFFIHIRFEPAEGLNPDEFIRLLPTHFLSPIQTTLVGANIVADQSALRNQDMAHAWQIHGEATEFVFTLIEGHASAIPLGNHLQFLHYITNPLTLGHKFLFSQSGFVTI